MLKAKDLAFQNIGRFVDPQKISFEKLGSLSQVDGNHIRTGGSSGAAKSTFFKAIEYLLGINKVPVTILQSRLTKDGISVTGTFDWDGTEVILHRSKAKGFTVKVGDEPTIEGSNKLAEEKLDAIIGMSRELFRLMLHKRQKEGGFFRSLGPAKTYEFFASCLGLEAYKAQIKKISEDIDSKESELEDKKHLLEVQNTGLQATTNALESLGTPPAQSVTQATVLELQEKYKLSQENLETISKTHALELSSLELERPTLNNKTIESPQIAFHESEVQVIRSKIEQISLAEKDREAALNRQISDLKTKSFHLQNNISLATKAKTDALRIAGEIKKLNSCMCPTCEQSWVTEAAKTKLNSLLSEINTLKLVVVKGVESETQIGELRGQIEKLTTEAIPVVPEGLQPIKDSLANLLNSIAQEKKKDFELRAKQHQDNANILKEFYEKQRLLKLKQDKEIQPIKEVLDFNFTELSSAVQGFRSNSEALKRYLDNLDRLNKQKMEYSKAIDALILKQSELELKILVAEDAKRAIKSYLSRQFDKALEGISNAATNLIRPIPNMSNATIQIEGIKETKDGKIKEEINSVISVDGEEAVPIASLSGGEESSLDLALDLAVIAFVEETTGKGIDLFLLDEPFEGLERVNIEMALEVIKNSNLNKKIIIVDHDDSVKEMVQSRLLVTRDGETSNISLH